MEDCRERLARVPFLDDLDLRYRNRVSVSIPMARAVMFCLMDVSGSMDEGKKDLAKRFFTLLYLFLSRKYEHVDLVFIRHTDNAEEVDERTFFYDPKSGGTIVLSALELMREILEKRYPPSAWNVYAAQASDGDSFGADAGKSARFPGRAPAAGHALLRLHRGAGLAGGAQEQPVGRVRTEAGAAFRDAADLRSRGDLPRVP